MRLPLTWRMLAPTLAVSVLLLATGLGSAWYVYRLNARVTHALNDRLMAVMAAEELVLSIRDVRRELERYLTSSDVKHFQSARETADGIDDRIDTLRRVPANGAEMTGQLDKLDSQIGDFIARIDAIETPTRGAARKLQGEFDGAILAEAVKLLAESRDAATQMSEGAQLAAQRVGTSLAVLGLCGAAAGLLAGFGVARSISRSIEELGGSVRTMAHTLQVDGESASTRTMLPQLEQTARLLSGKTVDMMTELELSRDNAARSGQLAAVGQLAAGLAHELRNPLAAIKLLVDTDAERGATLAGQELRVVQDEIHRMEQMLQSFLDFARPPKLLKQAIDLGGLLEETVSFVRQRADRQHVDLRYSGKNGPTIVSADPLQLRQVVLNLLLNAIDAQPAGGAVAVELAVRNGDGRRLAEIFVADEGPGLPEELGDRIFEPFVSTKETGVGLGLAISRRIVRSHGGEIKASHGPRGGAVFAIALPMEE